MNFMGCHTRNQHGKFVQPCNDFFFRSFRSFRIKFQEKCVLECHCVFAFGEILLKVVKSVLRSSS